MKKCPRSVRPLAIVAVIVAAINLSAQAQPILTEAQARTFAATAAASAKGERAIYAAAFTNLVKSVLPTFEGAGSYVSVHYDAKLLIAIFGPANQFLQMSSEAVRKIEPIEKVPWPEGVAIAILPKQIDSPDIQKVVVTRDGVTVEPLSNALTPQVMTTRMGAKVSIGAGQLIYPIGAFAPGAAVVVTAIPRQGTSNIVKALKDEELKKIQ